MGLELEAVRSLVHKNQRSLITQHFLDTIENSVKDTAIAEAFKDNFVSYLGVLGKAKFKMEDYVNAVKYVSFKLMNYTNVAAYAATFPERYQRLVDEGQTQIDSFASMYNRNKLVMLIYEQTMIPSYVLNAPLHQDALNELALMIKDPDVKGLVKVKACETILNYTKAPEIIKNELVIGMEQQETIADLRSATEGLAEMLKTAVMTKGMSLKEASEMKIVDAEYTEVADDSENN